MGWRPIKATGLAGLALTWNERASERIRNGITERLKPKQHSRRRIPCREEYLNLQIYNISPPLARYLSLALDPRAGALGANKGRPVLKHRHLHFMPYGVDCRVSVT